MKSSKSILNCGINLEFECEQKWESMNPVIENNHELFEGSLERKKCTVCNKTVHLIKSVKALRNGANLRYCMLVDPNSEIVEMGLLKKLPKDVDYERIEFTHHTLGVFKIRNPKIPVKKNEN
jgi:hypothetical protein